MWSFILILWIILCSIFSKHNTNVITIPVNLNNTLDNIWSIQSLIWTVNVIKGIFWKKLSWIEIQFYASTICHCVYHRVHSGIDRLTLVLHLWNIPIHVHCMKNLRSVFETCILNCICIWMAICSIHICTMKQHSMSTCRQNKHTQRHLVEAENAILNCENWYTEKPKTHTLFQNRQGARGHAG